MLSQMKYPDDAARRTFFRQVLTRLENLPGVTSAGVSSVMPLSGNFDGRGIEVESQPRPRGQGFGADLYVVTPGYLQALRIGMVKGRALDEHDTETGAYVALVNETMARQLWPNADPLGQRLRLSGGPPGEERPWRTVVGVVRDVRQYGFDQNVPQQFYLPHAQQPFPFMSFAVRASGDPLALAASVRRELQAVDKDQAVFGVTTLEQLAADSLTLRRFSMWLLGVFAGVALLLAAVGIYGVIATAAAARTTEIGIRMALGAQGSDVLRLVLKQGASLIAGGIAVGLLAGLAATRWLTHLLFEVTATDPLTFAFAAVLLTGAALLACYIPARRATKVDPLVALRYEYLVVGGWWLVVGGRWSVDG